MSSGLFQRSSRVSNEMEGRSHPVERIRWRTQSSEMAVSRSRRSRLVPDRPAALEGRAGRNGAAVLRLGRLL